MSGSMKESPSVDCPQARARTSLRRVRTLSVLVACAAAVVAPTTATAQTPSTEALQGSIRFSWWGGPQRNQKTNAVADLFEKQFPGAKIERETSEFGAYWDKLSIQSAGRNQPCAIQMQSRYLAQFAGSAVLRPLDDLVASRAIRLAGIAPPIVETGKQPDGKLYMVPYGVFYYTVMYNRSLLESAGASAPGENWTWRDFAANAKTLQPKLPRGVKASALLGGEPEPFFAYVIGEGHPVFGPRGLAFPKSTMIEWYKMWEDLRKAGVTQTAEVAAETNRTTIEDAPLSLGKIVFDTKPANQLQAHVNVAKKAGNFSIDIHKFPSGSKAAGDVLGTNGISIGANCNEAGVKLAAAWIDFFVQNPEASRLFASDNGVVTVAALQADQLRDDKIAFGTRRQIELLQIIQSRATPEIFPKYYRQIAELLKRNYQSVAFGTTPIDTAVDEFFNDASRIAR